MREKTLYNTKINYNLSLYNLAEKFSEGGFVSAISGLFSCCWPMLSRVTPEAPCDRIEEPASSIVNLDATEVEGVGGAFSIGLFPLKSFLGLSSGDITSASSSAVSSGIMLGLVPWKETIFIQTPENSRCK